MLALEGDPLSVIDGQIASGQLLVEEGLVAEAADAPLPERYSAKVGGRSSVYRVAPGVWNFNASLNCQPNFQQRVEVRAGLETVVPFNFPVLADDVRALKDPANVLLMPDDWTGNGGKVVTLPRETRVRVLRLMPDPGGGCRSAAGVVLDESGAPKLDHRVIVNVSYLTPPIR